MFKKIRLQDPATPKGDPAGYGDAEGSLRKPRDGKAAMFEELEDVPAYLLLKKVTKMDLQGAQGRYLGDSDDDSVMYNERDGGRGVPPDDHEESQWDIDLDTGDKDIRRRRCKKHPGEHARYVCKDHEAVLCPKCLVSHKICDFQSMGASLTHEGKLRFRHLLTTVNVRYNLSQSTLRKVKKTINGLDLYKDKQIDDINYNFDEVIRVLNARRHLLVSQVSELVNRLKIELRVDEEIATKKRNEEAEVLAKVRDLQNFVFAVPEKEHKRTMAKWK